MIRRFRAKKTTKYKFKGRSKGFTQVVNSRKIEVQGPIGVIIGSGLSFGQYTFWGNGATAYPIFPLFDTSYITQDILGLPTQNGLYRQEEFYNQCRQYAFHKINGVAVSFERTQIDSLSDTYNIVSLPEITLWPGPPISQYIDDNITTQQNAMICGMDNALKIQVVNSDNASKYFKWPEKAVYGLRRTLWPAILNDQNPDIFGGSETWVSSTNIRDFFVGGYIIGRTQQPHLYMGFTEPPRINVAAGADFDHQIGEIFVTFYISFCKGISLSR